MPNPAVLCYIEGNIAYFTTQPLAKQWGDDWNDAPYEHNAGEPYSPHSPEGDQWEISKLMFEGPLKTPADIGSPSGYRSLYSVEEINALAIAWLTPEPYSAKPGAKPILAGCTKLEFTHLVEAAGGTVYVPRNNPHLEGK